MKHKIVTGVIRKPLSNGNNGQSKHWGLSHRERKEWLDSLAKSEWLPHGLGVNTYDIQTAMSLIPPDSLLGLEITRVIGKGQRKWDADSVLRGNAKQLIDSLVEFGLAEDDSPRYIDWVHAYQDDSDRSKGPSTVVTIYTIGGTP